MKKTYKAHLVVSKDITDSRNENPFININESQIDETAHLIKNVCLFGTRYSKNGYTYQDNAIDRLTELAEGCKFFINHESKSESKDRDGVRDIRDWAGVFSNPKRNGDQVIADLSVRESYWPLVKDVAIMKPEGVGNSINSRVKIYKDEKGHEHIVDVDVLKSTDLVASAATTRNLFESKLDLIDDKDRDIVDENDVEEGLLKDKIKQRKMMRQIDELGWNVMDLIQDIIRDSSIKMTDKKTQVSSIMDDYESEVDKILAGKSDIGKKDSNVDDKINNNIMEDEDMDFSKLTLEELKKERPDIVTLVESSIESSKKSKELEQDNISMKGEIGKVKTENEELKKNLESTTKERDELKNKVDKYEVAEKKAEKETFIADKVKELKLPDEVMTDVFKEDLMSKDNDSIVKALTDRKELWTKKGTGVHGVGDEYNMPDPNKIEPVTDDKKKEAKASFKSTLNS